MALHKPIIGSGPCRYRGCSGILWEPILGLLYRSRKWVPLRLYWESQDRHASHASTQIVESASLWRAHTLQLSMLLQKQMSWYDEALSTSLVVPLSCKLTSILSCLSQILFSSSSTISPRKRFRVSTLREARRTCSEVGTSDFIRLF